MAARPSEFWRLFNIIVNYQYKAPKAKVTIESKRHAEAQPSSLAVLLHITSINGNFPVLGLI